MAKLCILPKTAEKIKKAFRDKQITIDKLFAMSSSQARVEALSKIVDKETAKFFIAKLEKGVMSPRQKQSIQNTVFQMFGHKALYSGVSIEQAKKMSEALKISDLKTMSQEKIADTLNGFLDKSTAERLAQNFINLKKTGNLKIWEEKTLGTEKLRNDARLKGSLGRLDALDDMGVLNPSQVSDYMATFVESRLGVSLTMEQSKELSALVKKADEHYDILKETNDFTYKNEKDVRAFFKTTNEIAQLQQEATPNTAAKFVNKIIDFARAAILSSVRIIRNSFMYQALPTLESYITKRLLPDGNLDLGEVDFKTAIQAKMFASTPSAKSLDFIRKQTEMAVKIYNESNIDISRLENLDDGFNLFGGEQFGTTRTRQKLSEAEGFAKVRLAIQKYVEGVLQIPKWTAGGTDMLAANIQRADTALVASRTIAFREASRRKFKTEQAKNDWIEKRTDELLIDSYSFAPKTEQGEMIRATAILDAHLSNGTQADGMSDLISKARNNFRIKNINIGKVLVPFVKIPTAIISRGIQVATLPVSVANNIYNINQASKIDNKVEAYKAIRKEVRLMVGNSGLLVTVFALAMFLDEDDYIAPYDNLKFKEYKLAEARGAGAGYVRIGGEWIPLRYLPIISIPFSAIMQARQNRTKGARGEDVVMSYLTGILGGLLDTPFIKDIYNLQENVKKGMKSSEAVKALNSLGLDGESLWNWAKVRAVPSQLSYDVWNMMFPKDAKYDFLGNEVGTNKKWYGFREDRSNEITLEFNRLNNEGFMPVLSDPKDYGKKSEMGDDYPEYEARLKKNYADKVSELINSREYKKKSDEDKKDAIDKIRQEEILDELKK